MITNLNLLRNKLELVDSVIHVNKIISRISIGIAMIVILIYVWIAQQVSQKLKLLNNYSKNEK